MHRPGRDRRTTPSHRSAAAPIARASAAVAAAAGVTLALVLAGCAQRSTAETTPSASATDTAVESTGTPTPRPTATSTPGPGTDADADAGDHGTLPDTCAGLITAGKWDDAFATAPLNDPAVVGNPAETPKDELTPVLQPDGAGLYCVWADPRADTTFLSIRVALVDSTKAYAHLSSALQGYDCAVDGTAYRCQKISQNPMYPVTDGDTYYSRGDVGIHIQQSNVATSGLLDDVVAHTR